MNVKRTAITDIEINQYKYADRCLTVGVYRYNFATGQSSYRRYEHVSTDNVRRIRDAAYRIPCTINPHDNGPTQWVDIKPQTVEAAEARRLEWSAMTQPKAKVLPGLEATMTTDGLPLFGGEK